MQFMKYLMQTKNATTFKILSDDRQSVTEFAVTFMQQTTSSVSTELCHQRCQLITTAAVDLAGE